MYTYHTSMKNYDIICFYRGRSREAFLFQKRPLFDKTTMEMGVVRGVANQ